MLEESKNCAIPAIVAVGYNRPNSLNRLLKSLKHAIYPPKNVALIISLDESPVLDDLLKIAEEFEWQFGEKKIIQKKPRLGLRKHILSCGDLSYKYGAVIILEDDIVVAKGFYMYVLQALSAYKDNEMIAGISLYTHAWNGYAKTPFIPQKNEYDAFLGRFSVSWGQCWTVRQWDNFKKWYEKNSTISCTDNEMPLAIGKWSDQSWGKYFAKFLVEKKLFYVIPYVSLSTNYSDVGVHTNHSVCVHQVVMLDAEVYNYKFPKIIDAIKYDMFFERILPDHMLFEDINSRDVCFDLNGIRHNYEGKKYVVTTKQFDKVAALYNCGIQLRPIEQNVLNNVKGEGIGLYKVSDIIDLKPRKHINIFKAIFVLDGYSYDSLWQMLKYKFIIKLKSMMPR